MNEALKNWNRQIINSLEILKQKNLYRQLKTNSFKDFSSNDYLSLNSSGFIDSLSKNVVLNAPKICASTGSRLIRGHSEKFSDVEELFANFTGAEAALLFHSGYAANMGSIPAIISRRDLVFCDRLCHASILDAVRLSGARRYYFKHNDVHDLRLQLDKYKTKANRWIITESVFSMDGDIAPIQQLCQIAKDYNCLIYLDEAHAIGVLGESGNGLACELKLEKEIAVRVFPCGKAPGYMGAFVAGSHHLKKLLINKARSFIYSTAQPPFMAAVLYQIILAMPNKKMQTQRALLKQNSQYLKESLNRLGYNTLNSHSWIIPVLFREESKCLEFQQFALAHNMDLRAIRPPTVPPNESRIRICVHSGHSKKDLDDLIELFEKFQTQDPKINEL